MALVMHITKREDVPNEPGSWIEFRKLGWRDLDRARTERQREAIRSVAEMGADVLKAMQDLRREPAKPEDETADPLTNFDRMTLLELGIAAWSYDPPVSAETVAYLDEPTAEWAARRVYALARPGTETERKNDG